MKRKVSLNNNSFDNAGLTKDCKDAICEYIWNGFEADATEVVVKQHGEQYKEAASIEVLDNGHGISYSTFGTTFEPFNSSAKNSTNIRLKSQANKGKGRFSYLCFSSHAKWTTVFEENGILMKYLISTDTTSRYEFDLSAPIEALESKQTGPSVEFPLFSEDASCLLYYSEMKDKLLEEFAWFIYLNREKNISLKYMDIILDVSQYIDTELSNSHIENIQGVEFDISLVVWKGKVDNSSKIFYMSKNGDVLDVENTSYNKNTVGFYHAVFIKSSYFEPHTNSNYNDTLLGQLELDGNDNKRIISNELKKKIQTLISDTHKLFLVKQADKHLAKMEKRGAYPQFSSDEYGQLRKKDFETVTRELYCVEPRIFSKLKPPQEQSLLGFLNLLLSSEERENVLKIIEQVVSLSPEERENFAKILQRSKLQYIVEVIGIIEKRAFIIEVLKKIVFDLKSFSNERDNIQKIVERHFWLFGEQYHLLTADKNLRKSLSKLESITNVSNTSNETNITSKESLQRVDIFLYTQRVQEDDSSEMLIIELKAPTVKLTLDVYNQVDKYVRTIKKEPRFNMSNCIWRFFAVCSEIDDDIRRKQDNFKHRSKKGLVDVIENFEIYAFSWADIFQSFEARHKLMLEKLRLDYSQISTEYGNDDMLASKESANQITEVLTSINI